MLHFLALTLSSLLSSDSSIAGKTLAAFFKINVKLLTTSHTVLHYTEPLIVKPNQVTAIDISTTYSSRILVLLSYVIQILHILYQYSQNKIKCQPA